MRSIVQGIVISLVEAFVGSVAGFLLSPLELKSVIWPNVIFWGLTFFIFYLGARFTGRAILWPALISFVLLSSLAILMMSSMVSEPVSVLLRERSSYLVIELALASAALWLGFKHQNIKYNEVANSAP